MLFEQTAGGTSTNQGQITGGIANLTGMTVTLDGNNWSVELLGGVLVNGSSVVTGVHVVTESAYDANGFSLATGLKVRGSGASGDVSYEIDNIKITTIPEASSVGLFLISAIGIISGRRFIRKG